MAHDNSWELMTIHDGSWRLHDGSWQFMTAHDGSWPDVNINDFQDKFASWLPPTLSLSTFIEMNNINVLLLFNYFFFENCFLDSRAPVAKIRFTLRSCRSWWTEVRRLIGALSSNIETAFGKGPAIRKFMPLVVIIRAHEVLQNFWIL